MWFSWKLVANSAVLYSYDLVHRYQSFFSRIAICILASPSYCQSNIKPVVMLFPSINSWMTQEDTSHW